MLETSDSNLLVWETGFEVKLTNNSLSVMLGGQQPDASGLLSDVLANRRLVIIAKPVLQTRPHSRRLSLCTNAILIHDLVLYMRLLPCPSSVCICFPKCTIAEDLGYGGSDLKPRTPR